MGFGWKEVEMLWLTFHQINSGYETQSKKLRNELEIY